jgi:eukaryotic-like serine/threonine-protein kinase
MKPTTFDEEEIFCSAVEIHDPARRDQFLRRACGPDSRLRQNIDAMLTDHEQATRLFQEVATSFTLDKDSLSDTVGDSEADPDIGTTIGPYRLLHRLGEGGGGIVYEAQQDAPVHRKVALKILKPGMDQLRVMNRFQAERQALELMEHPNIACVLDAGMTADGRPYFVMELVRGAKITVHCARHAVPLAARLQMLQQVCSAVQHAHQKGIIHCDLKPSNILVALVEGTPVPKVIDFGIAKATAGNPAEWSLQACPVGTPAYMSPEQINGSTDIDTRSDIYSLGAVMYELLAGRPPFGQEESSRTALTDIRLRLANEQPLPPSLVARQNGAARVELNEDLDWIVMTALDKDRERRYATMRGLGEDIAHFLANEPIRAHPPSRLYRFRKLVQRNRLASGALAAGMLTLVVGFTTSTLLYLKAEAAEQRQVQLRSEAQAAERKQAQLRAEAEERERVAKAAILLMQNKTAEADAEIQLMGGMLTQPSVEATNVFHKLATWNALRGDWKNASQRLLALSRVNRFDDSDMTDNATRDLVAIAPTLIEAGNLEALGQFEMFLTDRLGHTTNPIAAEQILKICLQYPPSQEIMTRLKPVAIVAEKSLPNNDATRLSWLQAWRCFALGLWNYRTGHFEQAVRLANLAMAAPRNEPVVNICCLTVRSMALRSLGQTAYAEADLTEAQEAIARKFSSPLEMDNEGLWHDWLTARILQREATPSTSPPRNLE